MKKRFYLQLALLLLMVAAPQGLSARVRYAITVTLTDFSDVRFEVAKGVYPRIQLKGKQYVIDDGRGTIYYYDYTKVIRIRTTVDDTDEPALEPTVEPDNVVVKIDEVKQQRSYCDINDLEPGEQVTLYSLDGREVDKLRANDKGRIDIRLGNYPQAVYIVKTSHSQFKITKK